MRGERPRHNPEAEGGFTLLEVVVSLALLGLLFAAVFGVFAAGMRSSRTASDYTRAVIEGERILKEVIARGVRPDVRQGITDGGYRWRAETKPDQSNADDAPAQLFHVQVSVSWPSGNVEKRLDLVTLAMASRNQPVMPDGNVPGQTVDDGTGVGAGQGFQMPTRNTR